MGPALIPPRRRSLPRLLLRLLLFVAVAAAATWGVTLAWSAIGGGPLGVHGLIALSLGVTGTAALTWALMALAFKSSREGWDDRADQPGDIGGESDKP